METLVLENDRLRLTMLPSHGARVVSIEDRLSGREWLTRGGVRQGRAGEDAVFTGEDSFGWDECFPTILPGDAPPPAWARPSLRDHGDLWGRPWHTVSVEDVANAAATAYESSDGLYTFERRIALVGAAIHVAYRVLSHHHAALPVQWAMHPCLALEAGERVVLAGVRSAVRVGYLTGDPPLETVAWPGPDRLDVVRGIEARFGIKVYAGPIVDARAAVGRPGDWMTFDWVTPFPSYLGVWLDYGAWPEEDPIHQVAIEPMTSPTHDLPAAMAAGAAPLLGPYSEMTWSVRLAFDESWPSAVLEEGPG